MGIYTIKGKQYRLTPEEEKKILSERTTITMFVDRLECLENMSDEEAGQFFKAIMQHFRTGIMPVFNERYMDAQLTCIKNGARILEEKYIKRTISNRLNSGSALAPAAISEQQKPLEAIGNDLIPKEAYTYTETEKYTGSDTYKYTEKETEKGTDTFTPTEEDIKRYFALKYPDKNPSVFLSCHRLDSLPENWRMFIDQYCKRGAGMYG